MPSTSTITSVAPVAPVEVAAKSSDESLGEFYLLDDVFKLRGADKVQIPLVAFPRSEGAVISFDYFTGHDMDRFIDMAARHYAEANIQANDMKRVALLGQTDLDWIVSAFALHRAGYTVLTASPRLSTQAIVRLMDKTHCESMIYRESPQLIKTANSLKEENSIQILPMMCRKDYDKPDSTEPRFVREVDRNVERGRIALIQHSSGSTGLPKAIYSKHVRYTTPYPIGPGNREVMTLPLYHSFGFSVLPQRWYHRRTIYFLNPNQPLTCENLTAVINEAQPSVLNTVPYVLKLLGEQQSGIKALKTCEEVIFIGSQCPDELGDRLVHQGVKLSSMFGTTECGYVGSSLTRSPGDNAWSYIRPPPPLMKQIWPKPIDEKSFEFVFLRDYPGRVESNSDDPPESYHSKDLYEPHPSIPNAWKYLGRLDDRVTLVNGEKVLPLPIEGCIREEASIREAVVFGVARSIPGLLAFRAEAARDLSDEEFINAIWPAIEAANQHAEGFSQIGRDMVVPLPAGIAIPLTDKGSMIRAQVYKVFEKEIDEIYNRLEEGQEGTLELDLPALEEYLIKLGQQIIGPQLSGPKTDLFGAGMDSLQAIQMRGHIVKDLNLGGSSKKLTQNIIFETANVSNLAKHLLRLCLNQEDSHEADEPIAEMRSLIQKHSTFPKHAPSTTPSPSSHTVLLTGATGSLGAHLLSLLLSNPHISKIYCLTRGSEPLRRLHASLQSRGLPLPSDPSKLSAISSDLSHPRLGLDDHTYETLVRNTTLIIHAAWPVNFQLPLSSFTPHIQALHSLLTLSLSSPHPQPTRLLFCSSIAAALATPTPALIPEAPVPELAHASDMGYARSKLVGERIVQAAVEGAGAIACVLRIGQVVGDTQHGMWNEGEMIPLVVKSAVTMGVLPELDMICRWLPVDDLAGTILELAGLSSPAPKEEPFYNILSPHPFPFASFVSALAGTKILPFTPVPTSAWLARLRSLSQPTTQNANDLAADPERNPALKLVEHFERTFGRGGEAGVETGEEKGGEGLEFQIGKAMRDSRVLCRSQSVLEGQMVARMVAWWLGKWGVGKSRLCKGDGGKEGKREAEAMDPEEVKDNEQQNCNKRAKYEEKANTLRLHDLKKRK